MNLGSIFDVFSRRHNPPQSINKPLTTIFRTRVLLLCNDVFSGKYSGSNSLDDYTQKFWLDIHRRLQYLHGGTRLSRHNTGDRAEDARYFLLECIDSYFLDFIEMIFRSEDLWRVCPDNQRLVDDFNRLFDLEDLPFALTGFVHEEVRTHLFGQPRQGYRVATYPQVICREHQLLHEMAIAPALELLAGTAFGSANREMLAAMADYRKRDYGDCLTKCGSAFESVMKIICDRKGWQYQQSDTVSVLLDNILPRTTLDGFFKQPLMLVGTLRNRLSSAHGAGTRQKPVPQHVARFAVNATAAAMLLLVEETQL